MSATKTPKFLPAAAAAVFLILLMTSSLVAGARKIASNDATTETGCIGAGLCCPGRNLTCSAIGQRPDDKDPMSTCYCDEACLAIGDCCLDYRATCRAVNCLVAAEWSDWSECDARCGYGVQIRTKRIVVHPANGGRPCGETIERRLCEGTNCKLPRSSEGAEQLKETAAVVPASFGGWRSDALYSPFEDIRQNLFMHFKYAELKQQASKPSYCAKFKITETRTACQRSSYGKKNVSSSPPGGANKMMSWPTKLVRGSTVCVECQQFAMQSSVGRRCAGHGVFQRETAWKAVTIPRCHGKWIMTTRHEEPCQCDPATDTSFVFV